MARYGKLAYFAPGEESAWKQAEEALRQQLAAKDLTWRLCCRQRLDLLRQATGDNATRDVAVAAVSPCQHYRATTVGAGTFQKAAGVLGAHLVDMLRRQRSQSLEEEARLSSTSSVSSEAAGIGS